MLTIPGRFSLGPLLVAASVLVLVVFANVALFIDQRAPLALSEARAVTAYASLVDESAVFAAMAETSNRSGAVTLRRVVEDPDDGVQALIDVGSVWEGPRVLPSLVGEDIVILPPEGDYDLEHFLVSGDYLVLGDRGQFEEWSAVMDSEDVYLHAPRSYGVVETIVSMVTQSPHGIVAALSLVVLCLLIPGVWRMRHQEAIQLLALNGAPVSEYWRHWAGTLMLPLGAGLLAIGLLIVVAAVFGGAGILLPSLLGIYLVVALLSCGTMGLGFLGVRSAMRDPVRSFGDRERSISSGVLFLGWATALMVGFGALGAVATPLQVARSEQANLKMELFSAFPEGTSTTNLYLVPGMPVTADPVWDQRLAEPFRQMDAEGKLALGTYSEPRTGLGLFEHSTVVTNDAYLRWIGTDGLRSPSVEEDEEIREMWRWATQYQGRDEESREAIAEQSEFLIVEPGASYPGVEGNLVYYLEPDDVVVIVPSLELFNDSALVSMGSTGELLIADPQDAEATFAQTGTSSMWGLFYLSDAGDAERALRMFDRVSGGATVVAALLSLLVFLTTLVDVQAKFKRTEIRMLLLDGRPAPVIIWLVSGRLLAILTLILTLLVALGAVFIPGSGPPLLAFAAWAVLTLAAAWLISVRRQEKNLGVRA